MTEYAIRHESITKQIAQLEREYEEKVKAIEQKGENSGKITILESEIENLQRAESDLEDKLRSWPARAQASVKAIILMPATVTSSPAVSE